jgi:hypothetical protein
MGDAMITRIITSVGGSPPDMDTALVPRPVAGSSAGVSFVQSCGRAHLSADELERIRSKGAVLDASEWDEVLAFSLDGGMGPLVFQNAEQAGLLSLMPPAVVESLADTYRRSWINNRRLRGELASLLDVMAKQELDVMLVKGVAIAGRYYGEIALRPSGDIDLLVHPGDAPTCERLLLAKGYRPLPGRQRTTEWHALVNRSLAFRHPDGYIVEVHWMLASRPSYVASFPLDEIWRSADTIEVAGRHARYLSAADELRFLSYHYAGQHLESRLIWLVDIAEVVRAHSASLDWERFAADTIARGLAMPVALALSGAESLLAVSLPPALLERLWQAATHPSERRAWRAARADRTGLRALYQEMKVQRGIGQRLLFGWQGFKWHAALPTWRRVVSMPHALMARKLPRSDDRA